MILFGRSGPWRPGCKALDDVMRSRSLGLADARRAWRSTRKAARSMRHWSRPSWATAGDGNFTASPAAGIWENVVGEVARAGKL